MRPERVDSRRPSGMAPASSRNGAKVTAALSLVSSSSAEAHQPEHAADQRLGRRMNATSADRYTRHRNVAWLSVQNRQAELLELGHGHQQQRADQRGRARQPDLAAEHKRRPGCTAR